ncbi:mannosyltransferase putative-domain-containing protein [Chytriomyces sp. MP71]|nr:mannosyltransferase putative-domain-containing protein [Chytriomyces sp. MP71]
MERISPVKLRAVHNLCFEPFCTQEMLKTTSISRFDAAAKNKSPQRAPSNAKIRLGVSRNAKIVVLLSLLSLVWIWNARSKPTPLPAASTRPPPQPTTPSPSHAPPMLASPAANHSVSEAASSAEPSDEVASETREIIDAALRNVLDASLDSGASNSALSLNAATLDSDPPFDVDLLQAQFIDFLNGEEGVKHGPLFGGSLRRLDLPFDITRAWNQVHAYALSAKDAEYNHTDFLHLGRRVRANLIAYTVRYDRPSLLPILASTVTEKLTNELDAVIDGLTRLIYPWISPTYPTFRAMQMHFRSIARGSDNDEGIVFCSGKWHFELAVHAITTFRRVLNSTLPIEVHHAGDEDLPLPMRRALNAMEGVRTVDVLRTFPEETKKWGGWSIKPFAMMASRFRKVMFVDADALFFQDPRVLFTDSAIFAEYGSLFYHDRSLGRGDTADWFKTINPEYTDYASTLRYMRQMSKHEMESGVVVVDKGRTGPLHALMMVCKLNSKFERDAVTYHQVYGDKETYWISWDITRVPYQFTPSYGGTVGYKNPDTGRVCGGLFHTDERLKPLWWNGGVVANKHVSQDSGFMRFEYAAFDTDGDEIVWDWETPTTPFCLGPRWPEKEVVELSRSEREKGERFVSIYKMIKGKWEVYFRTVHGIDVATGETHSVNQEEVDKMFGIDSNGITADSALTSDVKTTTDPEGVDIAQIQLLDFLNGEVGLGSNDGFVTHVYSFLIQALMSPYQLHIWRLTR